MDYFWRCKCGDEALNTPDGQGLLTIRRHRMNSMKEGEKGHHILGLFDKDGNCVVAGDRPQDAVKLGLMQQAPVPIREQRKAAREGRTVPVQGLVRDVSGLQGVLTAMRIALPPSTWGWLSLGFQYLRKSDGAPFAWTPEDVGLYISEVITFFHQEHLAEFFGLNRRQAAQPEVAAQLQAIAAGIGQMDHAGQPGLPVEVFQAPDGK
jgi:hypothetical protein